MVAFLRGLFAMIFLALWGATYTQDVEGGGKEVEDDEDPMEILKQMDTNVDGKLTFQEIFDGIMGGEDGDGDEHASEKEKFKARLQKHFKASDSNGDEGLDDAELKTLIEAFESEEEEL
mmetsp:Transcript_84227/g.212382  ORF Transcript_84227/g.212382 Transcript_84227/m.212382 type:complete len:119 (-) Transcript_84227:25-381(-)